MIVEYARKCFYLYLVDKINVSDTEPDPPYVATYDGKYVNIDRVNTDEIALFFNKAEMEEFLEKYPPIEDTDVEIQEATMMVRSVPQSPTYTVTKITSYVFNRKSS